MSDNTHETEAQRDEALWLAREISHRGDERAAELEAKIEALCDLYRGEIRAHMDGCAATFSNNVPADCGCGLSEKRDHEITLILEGIV